MWTERVCDGIVRKDNTVAIVGSTPLGKWDIAKWEEVIYFKISPTNHAVGVKSNGMVGSVVSVENARGEVVHYAYDPLGQLTAFTQSTGYAESYAYDKAGNMTQKVIADGDTQTTQKMAYNKGNRLIAMTKDKDSIAYAYDKNGNMTQKALRSKAYGKMADTYAYDALGYLESYVGYDGYTQVFTYNAEAYDAATGMINLCARQYEPAMGRFSQKESSRGNRETPLSPNRNIYVNNNAPNAIDPSGNVARAI